MEKPQLEPEETKPRPPSKMPTTPRKLEFESPTTSATTRPKDHSPPREPELEPTRENPLTKTLSPSREPDGPKFRKPPLELKVEPAPPIMLSLPLEPHHNSKTQSLPLDLSPEEREHHKNPPFKSVTTPDTDMAAPVTTKFGPTAQEVDAERGHSNLGSGRVFWSPNLSILKRDKRENMVTRALFGFRVCGFVFSLVSFSVLAADRDRGWARDSFYRYKEFRYCMAVNVITFAYSGYQAYDLIYQLTTRKRKIRQHHRYYLDFSVDQILSYLLLSASSSAAVRVDDWQSNWGKDEFPDIAMASVAFSFLAFVSLAFGSLISGYFLSTLKSI